MTNTVPIDALPSCLRSIPKPVKIKKYLDQYVIGQDEAKITLAVAVYNHYKRLQLVKSGRIDQKDLGKSNILLFGNTGCGKTHLVKTIARMLNVPYYIQDCTKITESGYVGSDVEDCIGGLLRSCDLDVEKAQMGIVMLDECDKLRKSSAGTSITRDVGGEGVQQSLLKIVEGDLVGVSPLGGRKQPQENLLYVDTSNILFIASGAFVGLEDIISKRLGRGISKIGFGYKKLAKSISDSSILEKSLPEDLHKYGMIPEFIGRFPVFTYVKPLEKQDLVRIMTETKDSLLSQYSKLMSMDEVKLTFTREALDEIAELAIKMNTGARGLRNIVEKILRDYMYEAPTKYKPANAIFVLEVTDRIVKDKTSSMID